MQGERKTLTQLSVPICLETLFYMLSGMVDTLMLSSVSDQAVGAVGTANTYIGVFIIMFGVISSGMIAVMSQNIGAGRPGIAYQARQLGLIFNALIGIVMSVILATFSGGILRIVSIAPALLEPAEIYLRIVGGACFLNALIPIFSSYLRVFGYTKHSLIGTVVGNVLNIILNSVFLFAFNWGVMGVAVATVISRVVNLIIVAGMGAVLIKAKQSPERITSRKIFAQIVKIGFPSALETALYNIAMTFIVRFMNQMDVDGMNVTARSYAIQIANFSYCVGAALAQANAIMTGWRIGAKEFEECNRGTRKAAIYGIITATCFSVTFAFAGHFIVHIFTDDTQMINLVVKLLIVDIFLELGRVTNLVYGQALKTSGDAFFPVILGAIFILWHLWSFIFGQKMYEVWDRLYHRMRIVRIWLWKYRKKRMAEKARNAGRKTRHSKKQFREPLPDTVGQGTEMEASSPANGDDVIGKTKIVYLEDPEVARKTPTRSEPLKKEPIEEDEEIRTDDVEDNFRQDDKRLTDEDKRELMAPVDSEPDPEFVTAMTFEDISNVAEVLMSENPDEQKAIRAASTIHHKMQETVILSFLTDKLSNQEKVNQLLSECLDDTGRPLARRKSTSKKKEAFDIGKFV